jgi:hypothetical protein
MSVAINSELANIPSVALAEQAGDVAAPSAGYAQLYVKAGLLYIRNAAGIYSPLYNPMTTQDDLIVAAASGVPGRLAKGSDGQHLAVNPSDHHLYWVTPAVGAVATDPIWDAAGDLALGSGPDAAGRLAKGADSTQLTVDPSDHAVKWMLPTGGGDFKFAEEVIIPGGGAASVLLPSTGVLDTAYRHALVMWKVRSLKESQNYDALHYRLNGDSGAHYNSIFTTYGGNAGGFGETSGRVSVIPAATATAGYFGVGELKLPFFADATLPQPTYGSGMRLNQLGSGLWPEVSSGLWVSTEAITTITFLAELANLDAGSTFVLYYIS